tara:strand:+ start:40 stop:195 length:156 start_codon:yes stop_codon:yes gene_type:complete
MQTKENMITKLHKNIEHLNQQVEEKDQIIKELRKQLEDLGYKKAVQEWVEL